MQIIVHGIAATIFAWLAFRAYRWFLAVWFPAKARSQEINRLQSLGGRHLRLIRFTSVSMLLIWAWLAVLNIAWIVLFARYGVAS